MPSTAYTSVVQRFYLAYFGRPADTGGLANFTASLAASGAPTGTQALLAAYGTNAAVRNLVDTFGNSAESRALYAGTTALDQVSSIYLNVLNRAGDAGGLAYWSGEVTAGRLPLSLVALAIEAAAEGTGDAGIVNTKAAIATSYTANLDLPSEQAGYFGNAAAASVRGLLRTVTTSDTVAGFDARVQSSIAGLVNAPNGLTVTGNGVLEGNSGTTNLPFTLTLDRPASAPITVQVATTTTGTATAGQDFVALNQAVTFAVGQQTATVNVQVIGDNVFEPNESVNLLATGTDARLTGSWQAQGTIVNDDAQVSAAVAAAQSRSSVNLGVGQIATLQTPNLTSLASSGYRNKQSITFSFSEINNSEFSGFQPFNEAEKIITRDSFREISSFTNIQFTEVVGSSDISFYQANTRGAVGVTTNTRTGGTPPILFASTIGIDVASAAAPNSLIPGGNIPFVIRHEIGHSLGLSHPFDVSSAKTVLAMEFNNIDYTVLSYGLGPSGLFLPIFTSSTIIVNPNFSYINPSVRYIYNQVNNYSLYDIEFLQVIYGANTNVRTGNDIYTLDTTKGERLVIWDAGGNDTIDVSNSVGSSIIDLRGGTLNSVGYRTNEMLIADYTAQLVREGVVFSSADGYVRSVFSNPNLYNGQNNLAIPLGAIIENVRTGAGNDTVIDNLVNNIISTGAGNDVIQIGNGGFDTIDGGSGVNTVVIPVAQAAVQRSVEANGHIIIVGSSFSADLVNIQRLQFNDGLVLV